MDFITKLVSDESLQKLEQVRTKIIDCVNVDRDFINHIVSELTDVTICITTS